MGRIAKLTDEVINQIAAGEVIERPASVVKELLENAIDAQATRILVDVGGGGVDLIRVVDNGCGMSREDAILSLLRHATSKVRTIDDIASIQTLGFRGEALPSIASVSRFLLTTQEPGARVGTRVVATPGTSAHVEELAAPAGTCVEVRDLFFNTPVRRKFLRRAQTESGHILDAVVRTALSRPHVAIRLSTDNHVAIDVPSQSGVDPVGRLSRVFGPEVCATLTSISETTLDSTIRVGGWAASPDHGERTTRGIFAFVNGRFVRDRTIQHAAQEAYRTLLEPGRYPFVLLWLSMTGADVDVNVHPQKLEVRFSDPGMVHRAITRALMQTMRGWKKPSGDVDCATFPESTYDATKNEPRYFDATLSTVKSAMEWTERNRLSVPPYGYRANEDSWRFVGASIARDADDPSHKAAQTHSAWTFRDLRPLDATMGTFVVCANHERVVIIDRLAVCERMAKLEIQAQVRDGRVNTRALLIPLTFTLDANHAANLLALQDILQAVGFDMEPRGDRTWLVRTIPKALGTVDPLTVLHDVVNALQDEATRTRNIDDLQDVVCERVAHHAATARSHDMSDADFLAEMDRLSMQHCETNSTRFFLDWTESELRRLFIQGK